MENDDTVPRIPRGSSMGKRILVVDDEEAFTRIACTVLISMGHDAVACNHPPQAVRLITTEEWDLLMLDLRMPLMTGPEVLKAVHPIRPNLPVVIITGLPESPMLAEIYLIKPVQVLVKPVSISDFERVLAALDCGAI